MEKYRHKQPGWAILATLGVLLVFIFFGKRPPHCGCLDIAPVMVIILIILGLFSKMIVIIDEEYLRVRFSYGVIRAKFRLADIVSCKPVRNPWYYGFGIHYLGNGWIYNVSGLDAVEITMKNNKVHRIGTDEPEILTKAISEAIGTVNEK